MEWFFIGLAAGVCLVAALSTIKSLEPKIEQEKVLTEHRKHKYYCAYCLRMIKYEDAVITDGKLSCPECGMELVDGGWYGVGSGGETHKRNTNGDYIRSMSNEELALKIPACPHDDIDCLKMRSCYECCLKWLQQEANG